MSVSIVRYMHQQQAAWGVVHGTYIAPLRGSHGSTRDFIRDGMDEAWSSTPEQAVLDLDEVTLLSPITADQQFLCQGTNYASHVRESGMDPSRISFNTIFTKAPSSLTSAHADVARPRHVRLLDYELELGLVIRRTKPPPSAPANCTSGWPASPSSTTSRPATCSSRRPSSTRARAIAASARPGHSWSCSAPRNGCAGRSCACASR
jgi:hypothetical protein